VAGIGEQRQRVGEHTTDELGQHVTGNQHKHNRQAPPVVGSSATLRIAVVVVMMMMMMIVTVCMSVVIYCAHRLTPYVDDVP